MKLKWKYVQSYNQNKDWLVGEVCNYSDIQYICIAPTTGVFDSEDWEEFDGYDVVVDNPITKIHGEGAPGCATRPARSKKVIKRTR